MSRAEKPEQFQALLSGSVGARIRIGRTLLPILALVLVPMSIIAVYLHALASAQFESSASFSITSAEGAGPNGFLGLFAQQSQTHVDLGILEEHILSQPMALAMNDQFGLVEHWSRARHDPLWRLPETPLTEDIVDFWRRVVDIKLNYDRGTAELRVRALDPDYAQTIVRHILQSTESLMAGLNSRMLADRTALTGQNVERMKRNIDAVVADLTEWRSRNQRIDPSGEMAVSNGLRQALELQLVDALVTHDLLASSSRSSDPRLLDAQRRIEVLERRIALEEESVSASIGQAPPRAESVAAYEDLISRLHRAEEQYALAEAAHLSALLEAQRHSKYVIAHVGPTLAETSQFPDKGMILLHTFVISVLLCAIWLLIADGWRNRF